MANFIETEALDNAVLVKISGKIGTEESGILKKELSKIIDEKEENIILDVNKSEYICSMGLGVILNIYKSLSGKNKKLIIINTNPEIDEIFTTTKMTEILSIVPDKSAALAKL